MAANAQSPFLTRDSLNINRINAMALVHGDMWYDPITYAPHCKFPPDTKKNVGFVSSVWLGGYDNTGAIHMAAQTYRQDGNDYWPGPLDATGALSLATSTDWAKIWKVNRSEVNYFLSLPSHTITNTPASILTWPGKGNANATGNGGVSLTISNDMAPFKDLNGDGIYQPLNGEYPDFPGEQALWWVFSDNGPTHTQTNGAPLKAEIQVLAYGYNRGTLIDYAVFYDYTIINRSALNYNNMRMSVWSDVDLGYYLDDYIAVDSARRMGIVYNANNDDGAAAGHPTGSYGANPPASGVAILRFPGDVGSTLVPMGSFVSYENSPAVNGNPVSISDFNYYMHGQKRDGTPFPIIDDSWDECASSNPAGDRRVVQTTGDFSLAAGEKVHIVIALVVDSNANGCPSVDLGGVKTIADTARNTFTNPPPTLGASSVVTANHTLRVYPSPAGSMVYVSPGTAVSGVWYVSVLDVMGRIAATATATGTQASIDISILPPGTYAVRCIVDDKVLSSRFVKE